MSSVFSTGAAHAVAGDWLAGAEGKSGFEGSFSASSAAGYADAGRVVGVDGNASAKLKDNVKAKTFGIRIGQYMNDNVRIYASIEQADYKGDLGVKGSASAQGGYAGATKDGYAIRSDYAAGSAGLNEKYSAKDPGIKKSTSYMMNADYVFMKDSATRLFVGASAGAKRAETGGKKKTGTADGFQAGVLTLTGVADFEAGVKYRNSNISASYEIAGSDFTSNIPTPTAGNHIVALKQVPKASERQRYHSGLSLCVLPFLMSFKCVLDHNLGICDLTRTIDEMCV